MLVLCVCVHSYHAKSHTPLRIRSDFNDGPGLDYFERHFLMHNVTTSLMGSAFYPELMFEHALIGRVPRKLVMCSAYAARTACAA